VIQHGANTSHNLYSIGLKTEGDVSSIPPSILRVPHHHLPPARYKNLVLIAFIFDLILTCTDSRQANECNEECRMENRKYLLYFRVDDLCDSEHFTGVEVYLYDIYTNILLRN
jgi:hypothetical protein